jgi:deoxycytidine triphosphate deaminase
LEITNNSHSYTIPLVVGRRIAQIIFFDTEGVLGSEYEKTGMYSYFLKEKPDFKESTRLLRKWKS